MLMTLIIAQAMHLFSGEAQPLKPPVADYSLGAKIYAIAFQAGTFAPSTIDTIETAGCVINLPPGDPQISQLRSLIFRADFETEGDFAYRMVRMKIEGLTLGSLYIDRYGGIIGYSWIVGHLKSDDLMELTRFMTDLGNRSCEIYWKD